MNRCLPRSHEWSVFLRRSRDLRPSIPGVVLIMYVTLLSLCIHAVYRQQRCRVRHCHSRNAPPSIANPSGRHPFLMLRTFEGQYVAAGICNFLQPPDFGLVLHGGGCAAALPPKVNEPVPSTSEIQYFTMPITYAKKGREMRPKCVALTGAGVQTRHHPNFKSRSATSSFQCRFHSTAPFVNSVSLPPP